MSKWLINNPFAVLLVPLVAYILSCIYWNWPQDLNRAVPLGVEQGDTTRSMYTIALLSMPQERAKTYRYEAQVLDGLETHPKVYVYIHKDSLDWMPHLGDTLLVYTCWKHPGTLNGRDLSTYLYRQGISGTGYVAQWAWTYVSRNQKPWWKSSRAWQQRLIDRYRELGISGRELATLSALTLGYREDLDEDTQRQFAAAGAMHVLAVSGLHTNILLKVLMAFVTLFGLRKPLYEQRGRRIMQGVVVMAALVAYAFLTGCTPSVVRSVVMSCLMIVALVTNRQGQMLNTVLAAAFLILVFRPMDLMSMSFQLSFAAVIAIVLFADGWNTICGHGYWRGIIGMSIAAMIGTMPITLYYYGQISNYFLLTNLIVLPLAWAMMVGGLITLTLGWWLPLGKALAWLLNGITWLMNEGVGWIESLPWSTTQVVLSPIGLALLMAVNLTILIAWKHITTIQRKWK